MNKIKDENNKIKEDYENIKKEYEKYKEDINKETEEKNKLNEEITKLKEENSNLKNNINIYFKNEDEINKIQEENIKIKNEYEKYKQDNNKEKEELIKLKENYDNLKRESDEYKTKCNNLEEENTKLKEEKSKIQDDTPNNINTNYESPVKNNTTQDGNAIESVESKEDKNVTDTNKINKEKLHSVLKKRSVKFQDNTTPEKTKNNNEDNNIDGEKTDSNFSQNIRMFSNKIEENEILKPKSEEIKTVKIKEGISADKTKNKEERMNKALQRIKKKRDKDSEEGGKRDANDIRFKSVKIKNMAALLEEHMAHNNGGTEEQKNEEGGEITKDSGKKEDPFENMEEMINSHHGKVVYKRKMTKKNFEV